MLAVLQTGPTDFLAVAVPAFSFFLDILASLIRPCGTLMTLRSALCGLSVPLPLRSLHLPTSTVPRSCERGRVMGRSGQLYTPTRATNTQERSIENGGGGVSSQCATDGGTDAPRPWSLMTRNESPRGPDYRSRLDQ